MTSYIANIRQRFEPLNRVLLLALVAVVASAPLGIFNQTASAAQLTSRSVTISSALAGASSVTYTFGLTPQSATALQGLKFQACTTALGTCTAPTGLSFSSATFSSQGGFSQAGNFAPDGTGANDCVASASILCANRTQAAADNTSAKTVAFATITNQNSTNCSSANNCTFFVRMTTYTTTTYTGGSIVDTGTVASSTNASVFTINAAIQEYLDFCVGATTINDATTAPAACSSISGTSLNIGILDSTKTNVSPVASGGVTQGDGNNGIAQLSTNATIGSTIAYFAVQAGTGTNHLGGLRVTGATCNAGSVVTDQCIDSQGGTQGTFTAGTEKFGMTIAAINCAVSNTYACSFAGATYKLIRNANYDGTGSNTYPTDSGQISGTTNAGYAWDESGTTGTIASSTTAVDKEALILKYAATPNITTPTGSYLVQANYIATPTF